MGQLVERLAPEHGCEIAGIVTETVAGGRAGARADFGAVDVAIDFSAGRRGAAESRRAGGARHGTSSSARPGWQADEAELQRDRRRSRHRRAGVGEFLARHEHVPTGRRGGGAAGSRACRTSARGFTRAHHAAKKDAPSGTALLLKARWSRPGYARADRRVVHAGGLDSGHARRRLRRAVGNGDADARGPRPGRVRARRARGGDNGSTARRGWFSMRDMIGRLTGLTED